MDSLRTVYNGDTDRLLSTFLLLGRNSILCDFHQWVLCLQSGELMISFADKNQYAHETDIHTINIYDLFESKLP